MTNHWITLEELEEKNLQDKIDRICEAFDSARYNAYDAAREAASEAAEAAYDADLKKLKSLQAKLDEAEIARDEAYAAALDDCHSGWATYNAHMKSLDDYNEALEKLNDFKRRVGA